MGQGSIVANSSQSPRRWLPNFVAGLAKGNNFGVGGGVGVDEIAIPASTYDLAGMHDHCADWNVARFQRSSCGAESLFHPEFVGDTCWSFVFGRSSLVRGHGVYGHCIGFGKRRGFAADEWNPADGVAGHFCDF